MAKRNNLIENAAIGVVGSGRNAAGTTTNSTTYRQGSTGKGVENLQQMLTKAGYDVGGVDGVYGSRTAAAVKEYQTDHGLTVDGIAGKNTLDALYGSPAPAPAPAPAQTAPKAEVPKAEVPKTEPSATAPGTSTAPPADASTAPAKPFTYDDFSYGDFTYADYAPSAVVNEADTLLRQLMANKPGAYQSQWGTYLNDYMNMIKDRDPFSYDLNSDALYNQYKDQYIQQGQMAMMDTMGQANAMTGGYGNSYAQTVGQQAYNQQLNQLNNIVPELYGMAYDKYQQEGQDLLNMYSMYLDRENQDYGRYQDELDNWFTQLQYLTDQRDSARDFDYNKWLENREIAYDKYTDDRNLAYDKWSANRNLAYDEYLNANERDDKGENSSGTAAYYEPSQKDIDGILKHIETLAGDQNVTLSDFENYLDELQDLRRYDPDFVWDLYQKYSGKFKSKTPKPSFVEVPLTENNTASKPKWTPIAMK